MSVRAIIVGSSHVGALKRASAAFAQEQSDVDVSFFAVRGPAFLKGMVGEDGVYTPGYTKSSPRDRDLAVAANGAETVDLSEYDHHLFLGQRFGFPALAAILSENDLLEYPRTGRPGLVPAALVVETMQSLVAEAADFFIDSVAPLKKPVTVAMSPYPALSLRTRTEGSGMARMFDLFWDHPQAELVFEAWLESCEASLARAGHTLLRQPAHTVVGPFATGEEWAKGGTDHDSAALANDDHRHMNEAFGHEMLRAYAALILQDGSGGQAAHDNERTKDALGS